MLSYVTDNTLELDVEAKLSLLVLNHGDLLSLVEMIDDLSSDEVYTNNIMNCNE